MAVTLYALLQIEPAGGLTEALSQSPLLALAVLFGAGVLTSLTPCVYPMIPITARNCRFELNAKSVGLRTLQT